MFPVAKPSMSTWLPSGPVDRNAALRIPNKMKTLPGLPHLHPRSTPKLRGLPAKISKFLGEAGHALPQDQGHMQPIAWFQVAEIGGSEPRKCISPRIFHGPPPITAILPYKPRQVSTPASPSEEKLPCSSNYRARRGKRGLSPRRLGSHPAPRGCAPPSPTCPSAIFGSRPGKEDATARGFLCLKQGRRKCGAGAGPAGVPAAHWPAAPRVRREPPPRGRGHGQPSNQSAAPPGAPLSWRSRNFRGEGWCQPRGRHVGKKGAAELPFRTFSG